MTNRFRDTITAIVESSESDTEAGIAILSSILDQFGGDSMARIARSIGAEMRLQPFPNERSFDRYFVRDQTAQKTAAETVFAFGEIERVERAINAVKTAIIDEHNYQLWQYEQEIWKHDHGD